MEMKINNLPVFLKALEIFKISRLIACAVTDNKNILELEYARESAHRTAGEIVLDSMRLAPDLAAVQNSPNHFLKLNRARNIKRLVTKIRANCMKMEYLGTKETEFLDLLKREVQQFDRLFSDWFYTTKFNEDKN